MYQYSVDQWILLFFLYSFAGYLWEVAYVSLRGHKLVNRGFLFGPILPIYGFGAITILHAALPVRDSVLLTALLGGFAASILEYFTGWMMEKLFGVRYWDYSNDPGNIRGYVCPRATFAWCVFSVLLVRWVHPFFDGALQYAAGPWAQVLAHALMAGFAVDTTISARQALDLKALLQEMMEENERLAAAGERLREAVARVKARRPRPFAAARRILRNNPSARAERFQELVERLRSWEEE